MMNNETALDLLLQLLNRRTSQQSLGEIITNLQPDEWKILLDQAMKRDLTLLLYDRLQKSGMLPGLPLTVAERLRSVYIAASARNAVMLHHAGQILQGLRRKGIDVIVLKGLYLIESVYSSIGLRTFIDLDLLVRKPDIPKALSIMQGLGYKLSTYYDAADPNTDIKHVPPMVKENYPFVEVHWGILEENEPFTINTDDMWQRAVPIRSAEVDVKALNTEDLILHLCLHFTYQHKLRAGIKHLFDIAEVIEARTQQIDWQKMRQTAQEWKAERVIWLTLQLLDRIAGVKVPESVIDELQPRFVDSTVLDTAMHQVLTLGVNYENITPDMVAFTNEPGVSGKLKRVLQRVFISRNLLARLYNRDPKELKIYTYYFVRFFDLLRQYTPTVRQLLKRDKSIQTPLQLEQASIMLREWMTVGSK